MSARSILCDSGSLQKSWLSPRSWLCNEIPAAPNYLPGAAGHLMAWGILPGSFMKFWSVLGAAGVSIEVGGVEMMTLLDPVVLLTHVLWATCRFASNFTTADWVECVIKCNPRCHYAAKCPQSGSQTKDSSKCLQIGVTYPIQQSIMSTCQPQIDNPSLIK